MKVVLHQPVEGANAGDTVDVGDLQGRWLIDHGYAHPADHAPQAPATSPVPESASPAAPEAPPVRAPKADWVDHAQALGLSAEEAEAMTKAQLVERFG